MPTEEKYRKTNDPENPSVCVKCGATIMAETVARPIWDGPFPCSGSGQCEYEDVPYCPNCEKKPSFYGRPIKVPFPGGD